MTLPLPLKNKTAVVTGSSKGIGRAIAIHLAKHGADLIIHGRSDSSELQSVCEEIGKLGRKSRKLMADFGEIKSGSEPSWKSLVEQAWAWKGKVDFWINNAGGDVLTGDWPNRNLEDKLEFLLQVDVTSTLMLSKLAADQMKLDVGDTSEPDFCPGTKAIVNIGWDQAWHGMAGTSGELFATTKGAIMSMTKSLAQSYAPQVRVNCIAPGWIQTQWGEQASDYWSRRAKRESLMGRWGAPEDVADVTAFLCSESASFISGQVIPVNGGFQFNKT
jgi:3-oxoacyl-[acyl-carrier protein] reductase